MTKTHQLKIFISWSGELSNKFAEQLDNMLSDVFGGSIKTYYSKKDIMRGDDWYKNIIDNLKDTNFSIICLTQTNLHAPWVNFESGALLKSTMDNSNNVHIATILINENIKIEGSHPLFQYQKSSVNNDDFRKLFESINECISDKIPQTELENKFAKIWDKYSPEFKNIIKPYPNNDIPIVEYQSDTKIGLRSGSQKLTINLNKAEHEIIILGINFVFARDNAKLLIDMANKGVRVKILALDPNGVKLPYFIINDTVSEESKRNQILSSYNDLPDDLKMSGNIEIRVVDEFFSSGCIGIDVNHSNEHSKYGVVYSSPYLFKVGVTQSPVIEIHNIMSPEVFEKYALYLNNLWKVGKSIENTQDNIGNAPSKKLWVNLSVYSDRL